MTDATLLRPRADVLEPGQQVTVWPEATLAREEVLARIAALPSGGYDRRPVQLGAGRVLDWLAALPGATWQERWLASGADQHGGAWVELPMARLPYKARDVRKGMIKGLSGLLLVRVLRPSYAWLGTCRLQLTRLLDGLAPAFAARMTEWMQAERYPHHDQVPALRHLTRIMLHTGRAPDQLTVTDLQGYAAAEVARTGQTCRLHLLWEALRHLGVLPPDTPPLHAVRLRGQRSVADLVDAYQIVCRPVRDVLVRYLTERAPSLDYGTLDGVARYLARSFWRDLEKHHPGIESLRLAPEIAQAWKQRVRQRRTDPYQVLLTVRTFYQDLAQWTAEDPSWVPWVAPSPVSQQDIQGRKSFTRRRTARMHQRTRTLAPVLPVLVRSAEDRLAHAEQLRAATEAVVEGVFEVAGERYERITRSAKLRRCREDVPRWVRVRQLATGRVINVTKEEDNAFWAWAVIETLRLTGVRIEELLEVTHLALSTYRLPDTGEVVPLLQIVPSKTDTERVLLVSPELAHVLARVVHRVRDGRPDVPLVVRWDVHEKRLSPPLPHLFQRLHGTQRRVLNETAVRTLLNQAVDHAGLRERDQPDKPLRIGPHDMRRIFATEAVSGGLPVHIAAKVLGHAQLTTTQTYTAVYQDDVLRHYRTFIARRRTARPSEEYREPTQNEWEEFERHFTTRKLELGTCGRPYGSPCQHEHACVRCPMLRVDPVQEPRLRQIIDNLAERIAEAKQRGWLGEVEGLEVSLTAARQKLENMQRARSRQGVTLLGTPIVRPGARRQG